MLPVLVGASLLLQTHGELKPSSVVVKTWTDFAARIRYQHHSY